METHAEITEQQTIDIFKDYSIKIGEKLDLGYAENVTALDINSMVVMLNWCFKLRNNFFDRDFNKKSLHGITEAYKQVKTNILLDHSETKTFFDNITTENLRILKFVLSKYLGIYDSIRFDGYHNTLCEKASKGSLQKCLALLSNHLKAKS
jgi:hypothetical protein